MLILLGIVLLCAGLLSGALLLLPAFGWVKDPSWIIWLLFPVLTLFGHLLIGLGRRTAITQMASLAAGALILIMATAATLTFFLQSAGFIAAKGEQSSLWILTGVGFMLGGALFSMGKRISTPTNGNITPSN